MIRARTLIIITTLIWTAPPLLESKFGVSVAKRRFFRDESSEAQVRA